ncbi:MAG: hypothetical protein CVV39_02185 [Planctomycetes bacterium HGW-Planctomycetes-1]|nr:MAG: hypothetical protein CVV39_02185 [Planctomycetes bacterium HGW-Planctomycetes-1]
MANSENHDLDSLSANGGIHEDEIDLIDYFMVLWRRKYFIFLATVLPALFVAVILFFWPRNYRTTYIYDVKGDTRDDTRGWGLNEKNYNVLLGVFYSDENLKKITERLSESGLEKYAKLLGGRGNRPERFVGFEAKPAFLDLSKSNINNPEILSQIRNMEASLLEVTITGKPLEDIYKMSSVVRYNIENVIPLYIVQQQLLSHIRNCNNILADIESGMFGLRLSLKKDNEMLEGLKKVNTGISEGKQDNIMLQFDIGRDARYLPLSYQIQAAESRIIEQETQIRTNQERYEYYEGLLRLNNKILAELNDRLASGYTVEQFKMFLEGLSGGCEEQALKEYLNSYIKRIENRLLAGGPIAENPQVHLIAKGTAKKSSITFVAALLMSIFAIFLFESFSKEKVGIS